MKHPLILLVGLLSFSIALQAQSYVLPDLPYPYNALEPAIDARTMEVHHSKHHQGYVTNLNKAVAGTPMATTSLEVLLLSASKKGDAVRNNSGGHYNHTLFWEILSPNPQLVPQGPLADAIRTSFGSLDSLKSLLNQAASTRFGSGWAWLYVGLDKKLAVSSSANQDNPIMDVSPKRGIPILGIDVWEHAYYLKYQNKRGDYLAAIWEVLDWDAVAQKYDAALNDPFLHKIELDTWTALGDFHSVMSQTFHPAESGNLKPIKERSGEMAEKAALLKSSNIPAGLRSDGLVRTMDELAKEASALDIMVRNKKDDTTLMKSLVSLHARFHEVMAECEH